MKKLQVILILVVVVIFVLSGCSSQSTSTDVNSQPSSESSSTTSSNDQTTTNSKSESMDSEKTFEINIANFAPATHILTTDGIEPWIKEMEQNSNGRLKFNHYPGATLVSAKDTWEGISSGLVDIGVGYVGYTPGRFSLTEVMSLPFLNIPSAVTGSKVIWQLYNENVQVQSQFPSVKMLMMYTNPPAQLHSTKKAVRTFEDIQGMTVRCPGSIAPIFSAIGASPAVMGAADAYEALERGVVDSTTFPWEALSSYKLHEVTRYHTVVNHYVGPYFVAINGDIWKQLPPDLRDVIEAASGEKGVELLASGYDKLDLTGRQLAEGTDHEIINLPQSELDKFVAGSEPVWNKWLQEQDEKGLDGQLVLNRVLDLVAEYTK